MQRICGLTVIEGKYALCAQRVCGFTLIERRIYIVCAARLWSHDYAVGFLVFYCVPLISIIILYSRIMKRLRQTRPGEEELESTRMTNLKQNRIVIKVLIWIVSALLICWTPLCVCLALKPVFPLMFSKDPCMPYLAGWIFYVFPPLNTVINPVILFVSCSNFSEALKELFKWKPSL